MAIILLLSAGASSAFTVSGISNRPAARAPSVRAQALSLDSLTFEAARGDAALDEAAAFFVDAFWSASTAAKSVDLTAKGRAELTGKQRDDMEERYGELVGARRLKSALLLARRADGSIAGCIGLEVAVLVRARAQHHPTVPIARLRAQQPLLSCGCSWQSVMDQVVVPRNRGEAMFRAELDAMSGRERNQYRKMPLPVRACAPKITACRTGKAHGRVGFRRAPKSERARGTRQHPRARAPPSCRSSRRSCSSPATASARCWRTLPSAPIAAALVSAASCAHAQRTLRSSGATAGLCFRCGGRT